MKIVLSAHFDIAKPVPFLSLEKGQVHGLVDNFAGVFVAYQVARKTGVPVFFTNFEETGMKGAREVAKELRDAARHPFSSIATRSDFPAGPAAALPPNDARIPLSFAHRLPSKREAALHWEPFRRVTRKKPALGGDPEKAMTSKASNLDFLVIVVDTTRDAKGRNGYIGNIYNFNLPKLPKRLASKLFIMPGLFEETEDETWVYGHEFGFPSLYFGVPISPKKDYHAANNALGVRTIDRATTVLVSFIRQIKKRYD